jgi:hypothetical protein
MLEYIYEYKNKIIFFTIVLLTLHSFLLIFFLGIDIPISDELDFIPFQKTFFDGGQWWEDPQFLQHYDHRQIFPSIILLASSIFVKGNYMSQMYLAVSFLTMATIVLHYLLKKTNKQFTWLIIPIGFIIFNASQSGCYLWATCAISWFLTSLLIILAIFFISKIETSKFAIIYAIIFSIIASFTIFHGLLIWVVGGFGLLFLDKKRKQSLVIWSITSLLIFSIYFSDYTHGNWNGVQINTIFTFEGIEYILLFLSNGLIVHLNKLYPIQIVLSLGIIMTVIVGSIYLKLQKVETNKIIPWVQMGLFGFLGATITELGRIGIVGAVASRYVAIAAFSQISALVIGTWIFLILYKKIKSERRRKYAKIIFIIIIVSLMLGISSSYYSGWKIGEDWADENSQIYDCLRDPTFDLKCPRIFDDEKQYNNLKILKELQLSVFSEKNIELVDPLLKNKNWENMADTKEGIGEIEWINSYPKLRDINDSLPTQIFVSKNESPIDIGGWGIFTMKDVDSAYVFIDDDVNSKAYYGFVNLKYENYGEKNKPPFFAGVGGIIDLHKLSDGCHEISFRIVHDIEYHVINTDSQICIK